MRAGKRISIQVLVILGILIGGELTLRAWAYFFRHSYQRYDADLGMIGLVPGYDGVTPGRFGGRIRINSAGFRGQDVERAKPAGAYRIVSIGDSATFGPPGENCDYPSVLGQLLGANGARRYEVINAGVEGYDSESALKLLERKLLRYQPDLITIYIGWNDLVKRDPFNPEASEKYEWLAYRMYDVYLIKFWRKLIYVYLRPLTLSVGTEVSPGEEAAYRQYVPVIFQRNLDQTVEIARRHGIRVVLFTLPSPLKETMSEREVRKLYFPHYTYNLRKFFLVYSRYNEAIRQTGRSHGVPVIDLAEKFRDRGHLFMDTSHPTCMGQRSVAEEIYRSLVPLGVVPNRS